jgi:hypothetical protein
LGGVGIDGKARGGGPCAGSSRGIRLQIRLFGLGGLEDGQELSGHGVAQKAAKEGSEALREPSLAVEIVLDCLELVAS